MNEVQYEAAQEQRCEDLCLQHRDRFNKQDLVPAHDESIDCDEKICRFGCPHMPSPEKKFIQEIESFCFQKRHELTLLGKEVGPLEEILKMITRFQFKSLFKKGD